MTLPDPVLDAVALAHATGPIRQHRKIDSELCGECHLGKGCCHRYRGRLSAERTYAACELSHLGQLMSSHVPKIEYIEHKQGGAIRDKVAQTDGLIECPAEGEDRRHVTDLRP